MSDSEQALVERIRAQDADALAEFVQLKSPQLLAFIQKRMSGALRRKVEPADILQELSSSAVTALNDMDLSSRDPFSWLCQQAERRIIDAHRHHIESAEAHRGPRGRARKFPRRFRRDERPDRRQHDQPEPGIHQAAA